MWRNCKGDAAAATFCMAQSFLKHLFGLAGNPNNLNICLHLKKKWLKRKHPLFVFSPQNNPLKYNILVCNLVILRVSTLHSYQIKKQNFTKFSTAITVSLMWLKRRLKDNQNINHNSSTFLLKRKAKELTVNIITVLFTTCQLHLCTLQINYSNS